MDAALRGKIDGAVESLAEQIEQGKSKQLVAFLRCLARFHQYSAGNAILIWLQKPEATHVAGFWTWKKLGRKVNRGEKGIQILAPVTRRQKLVLENDEEVTDETVVSFRPTYVWDVSQTEGKSLPEPAKVHGDPGVYSERLRRFVTEMGITLKTSRRLGMAQGVSSGGTIVLSQSLDSANSFSTLVHELAHELLHRKREERPDRKTCETEAEAVAFVVCEAVGLEPGTASSDYLLSYKADRKALMASLQRIRRTVAMIIDGIQSDDVRAESSPGCSAMAEAA